MQSINPQFQTVSDFISFLKRHNINKFHFIWDDKTNKLISSHTELQPVADFLQQDKRDFNNHEGMFFRLTDQFDVLQGAFIHRTNRGQAAGGVRFWTYDSIEDYFRDGMRLARGMAYKNALAGLWWGGGKGVMTVPEDVNIHESDVRKYIYSEYGRFMTMLQGCYVTAEDVGTSVEDMAAIFSNTRFTTCIPEKLGGSGNPSIPTARGVLAGLEAALDLSGETLEGKTIVVQGVGHVGLPLVSLLLEKNVKKIIGADISEKNLEIAKKEITSDVFEPRKIEKGDDSILFEECDILAPCATGAILNDKTIPKIKAKIICGAANNQLEEMERDDQALFEKGIIYVPDFLTNRMGIVNCANEQYGYVNADPVIEQHLSKDWDYSVHKMTQKVLSQSKSDQRPPSAVAFELADTLSKENHPIFGHRSYKIIKTLKENKWFEK